ncbi:hypothetical protein N9Z41_01745 [bacterium]|nr:hypothetical protein [bacterium]
MFKFIIRWTMRSIVILFVGFVALVFYVPDDYESTAKEVKVEKTVAKKEPVKIVKVKAPTLNDKIRNKQGNIVTGCMSAFKSTLTYPTEVDANWSTDSKYWKNFNGNNHRYLVSKSGKMMNHFGNMVPFKVTCKADWNSNTNKIALIEMYVNGQVVFAQ